MVKALAIFILAIYSLCLLFILLYSFVQARLVWIYKATRKNKPKQLLLDIFEEKNWPSVCVQLPIFNERYVVERLLNQVAELNYPGAKLEIQVLDDSTDETSELIATIVSSLKNKGLNISHLQRENRVGFKAGALEYGLKQTDAAFIAIFDADFMPQSDFLIQTMGHFLRSERVAVVQTKWGHLNRDHSMLTELQAFGLDAHFSVEQGGRNGGGHFINFNGTAGVWRKESIVDAGGWQHDTITEDLDLSYRAQLRGWEFIYLEDVVTPAELPMAMPALKSQQFRWTKGAAECTRKNLGKVLRATNIRFGTKIHAAFHLMNSFVFICVITAATLSVPLLWIKHSFVEFQPLFNAATLCLVSFVILSIFYWISYERKNRNLLSFIREFPLFLSVSMGLSLSNSKAVIEGYLGKKTAFLRTPKFNVVTGDDAWLGNKYLKSSINLISVTELLFTLYFSFGLLMAFSLGDFGLFPFHLMLVVGFGFVTWYSFSHSLLKRKRKNSQVDKSMLLEQTAAEV